MRYILSQYYCARANIENIDSVSYLQISLDMNVILWSTGPSDWIEALDCSRDLESVSSSKALDVQTAVWTAVFSAKMRIGVCLFTFSSTFLRRVLDELSCSGFSWFSMIFDRPIGESTSKWPQNCQKIFDTPLW